MLSGIVGSLVLAWMSSELPRRAALVREKEQRLAHERMLRQKLQQAYLREHMLHNQLQESSAEQQVLILKQKLLLDEVNRLYREEEQRAMIDPVTGLLKRQAFLGRLEEEIARCQGGMCSFLLIFLDLDHFKAINDTWGHLAGDLVLREVAGRLQQALGPADAAGRYGGEELTLMLTGATLATASMEGERLRQTVHAAPCRWQSAGEAAAEITVTMSIGIAAYGIHGVYADELIRRAESRRFH